MASFENKYNISVIRMYKVIHNLCPIGKDLYTNNLDIKIIPGNTIPDYIEVEKSLDELEGKQMVIEDVVNQVLEKLKQYEPKKVNVVSSVSDAIHLEVNVEAEYTAN